MIIQVKKVKSAVGFNNEKKNMVATRLVRYSTISTRDIIRLAAADSGLSEASVAASFYAIEHQVNQMLLSGHSLQLGNIGTFYLASRSKAVENEEDAGAKAIYRIGVKFRQSAEMRNYVANNVRLSGSLMGADGADQTTADTSGGGSGSSSGGEEMPLTPQD